MSHAHIPAARKGSDSEIIALSRQAAKDLVQVPSSRARSKSMDESQMEDESDRLRMIEARLFELNSEAFGRAHERDEAEHGSENALLKRIEERLLGRVRLDDAQRAAQCAEHDAGVTAGSSGGADRVGMQPRTQHPRGRQALADSAAVDESIDGPGGARGRYKAYCTYAVGDSPGVPHRHSEDLPESGWSDLHFIQQASVSSALLASDSLPFPSQHSSRMEFNGCVMPVSASLTADQQRTDGAY